jgi:hypothetical protein
MNMPTSKNETAVAKKCEGSDLLCFWKVAESEKHAKADPNEHAADGPSHSIYKNGKLFFCDS